MKPKMKNDALNILTRGTTWGQIRRLQQQVQASSFQMFSAQSQVVILRSLVTLYARFTVLLFALKTGRPDIYYIPATKPKHRRVKKKL